VQYNWTVTITGKQEIFAYITDFKLMVFNCSHRIEGLYPQFGEEFSEVFHKETLIFFNELIDLIMDNNCARINNCSDLVSFQKVIY